MSNLEELIERLCPDGVEYKELKNIIKSLNTGLNPRKFFKLNTEDANNYYVTIREIRDNKIVFSDSTDKINDDALKLCNNRSNLEVGDILFSGTGTIGMTALIDEEPINWNIKEGVYAIKPYSDIIDSKFLMYMLQSNEIKKECLKRIFGGTVKSISMKDLMSIKLPVPPLEVQREIVRILDNFTFLTTELAAELAARQKQYEYFRDLLLNDCNGTNGKIIDMLVQPITDGPHITPTLVSSGIPFVSAEAIFDGRVNFEKKRGFITEKFHLECCRKYKPQKNDVYLVKSGSTTGKVAYVYTDEEFNIWSPIAALRTNADNSSRFLFHLLQSNKIQQQVKSKSSHGSQPNLSMRVLEQFDVVIPSLEEQNQIANLLDRFDTLCNNISDGLPAEITMRQKQYEYYRDKLLTFKELKKEA